MSSSTEVQTANDGASIGNNLTLAGAGADATNLDGDDTVQVLQIGNAVVTLQDLTIRKGYGDLGGGISNTGTFTLRRVDVTDNFATYGAGIYSNADGTLTVETGSRAAAFSSGRRPVRSAC